MTSYRLYVLWFCTDYCLILIIASYKLPLVSAQVCHKLVPKFGLLLRTSYRLCVHRFSIGYCLCLNCCFLQVAACMCYRYNSYVVMPFAICRAFSPSVYKASKSDVLIDGLPLEAIVKTNYVLLGDYTWKRFMSIYRAVLRVSIS